MIRPARSMCESKAIGFQDMFVSSHSRPTSARPPACLHSLPDREASVGAFRRALSQALPPSGKPQLQLRLLLSGGAAARDAATLRRPRHVQQNREHRQR